MFTQSSRPTRYLALAALLLCTVAGGALAVAKDKEKGAEAKTASGTATAAAPAAGKLTEARLNIYREAIKNAKKKNLATQQKAEKMRDELLAIISADKFDKTAYVNKNKEIETLNAQMRASITEAAAGALAQYTPEERKQIASHVSSAGKSSAGHGGKRDKKDKGGKSGKSDAKADKGAKK